MTEYLKIEVEIGREISEAERMIIDSINRVFSRDDLYISPQNGGIELHLNRMDISRFRSKIGVEVEKAGLPHDNIFTELLLKVESIGSYGVKAGKLSFVDYNRERKVKGRKQKAVNRGMYYYARDSNFVDSNNEVPEKLADRIVCGDSEEILKDYPDNSVDLVLTSPPYNFGLEYEDHEDGVNWNSYFGKLFTILGECVRVTKFGGRIAINVQPLYSDYIPVHHIISNFLTGRKMIWRNEILWEKNNYNAKYTAWGSWKSPSNPYLKYTWEFIEVFSKGDLKHRGDRDKSDITGTEFKSWVNARWNIAPERKMRDFGHPAMFPEKLAERVIKLFSFKGDLVLDPFNGVGTTTKVAHDLNRRYVGIDISDEYAKKARSRIVQ
ncbi:DNA methylase [uncultured archaeon]|nr:DNA methylase [uncultured archaeon]